MNASHLVLPTKACHNCRRKRWKCDRSLPVCQKCLSSGTECLGYGKLFVWADGLANRGKPTAKPNAEKKIPKEEIISEEKTNPPELQLALTKADYAPENHDTVDSSSTELVKQRDLKNTEVHWSLVDPLIQDLNQHSRYYMYHFATQLCADMVVYDSYDQNPMRGLIPATSASPLLLQIILANSAFHVFNLSEDTTSPSSYQSERRPCLVAYYKAVSRYGGPLKTSYRDALIAKQQALSLLARSVATVNEKNIDLILATILLFVNYDLIESGKDKWKVHMEGGRKLIDLLGTPSFQPQTISRFRTHILADFLVFYILGSLFSSFTAPNFLPDTIDIMPILRYAETNNYLSCPAPLLQIMLQSFNLPNIQTNEVPTAEVQAQLKDLLESALAFDPLEWLTNFQPATPSEDLRQRLHIASAHRSGVCIYLARHLPWTHPLIFPSSPTRIVNLTGLADDIIHNISQLGPQDMLFKSISWPLFLAGTESIDPVQRTWIMNTLDEFYNLMYWGYIRTGKKTLEKIWEKRDATKEGEPACWVVDVKDMGTEILIA